MQRSIFIIVACASALSLSLLGDELFDSDMRMVPQQSIDKRYNKNFPRKHDKGFYLDFSLGPQWNQSIQNPSAGAVRFGGDLSVGFFPIENFALYAGAWGYFLEEASVVAFGPGVAYFFGSSNAALSFKFGVARVFNVTSAEKNTDFRETVLATELGLGKYWWLSDNTSLGLSMALGLHGLTLTTGGFSSVGWNGGLRMGFVYG